MNLSFKKLFLAASMLTLITLPTVASAQLGGISASQAGIPARFGTFDSIIKSGFSLVILVSGILFVVLLLLGGVQYLTSLGQEEQLTKARALMLNAVIGLVIVITSFAIGTYVLGLLGIGSGNTLNTGAQQGGSIQGGLPTGSSSPVSLPNGGF